VPMIPLRHKLALGQPVVGCVQMLPCADVSEILALAGFEFVMIDHEHGAGTHVEVSNQLRAVESVGVSALVRVSSHEPSFVARLLDAGVSSVLFPNVESAAVARAAVQACRYSPNGTRGAGGGIRAAGYGTRFGYYEQIDRDILIGVQIESVKAVERIDEIADVEGVDLIVIGPRDLSASIGLLNKFDAVEVEELCRTAEEKIIASGKMMGSVIYAGCTALQMFERGHKLLLAATDVGILMEGARARVAGCVAASSALGPREA